MNRRFLVALLKSILFLCGNYFLFVGLATALFYNDVNEFEKIRWLYGSQSLLHLLLQGIWLRAKHYPAKNIVIILGILIVIYLLAFP